MWRQESRNRYLDRWQGERKRKVKKKARLEKEEQERLKKVPEIKKKSRDELAERKEEQCASLDDLKPTDDRGDSTSIRSTTRNSANFIRSMNTNKALPIPPSDLESSASDRIGISLQSVKSASHMYAEYACSLRSTRSSDSPRHHSEVRAIRKDCSARGST
jgi:hypothetical protein